MSKIHWPRVLGCGLLAGIVWIVLGSVATALLGRDFAGGYLVPNVFPGKTIPTMHTAARLCALL